MSVTPTSPTVFSNQDGMLLDRSVLLLPQGGTNGWFAQKPTFWHRGQSRLGCLCGGCLRRIWFWYQACDVSDVQIDWVLDQCDIRSEQTQGKLPKASWYVSSSCTRWLFHCLGIYGHPARENHFSSSDRLGVPPTTPS